MSDASVRVIDGRAVVRVGGSELLAPIAKKATDAVALAEAARDEARNAADTVQATSRYFTTRAAGEAASALNQAFATDDGAGNVIYYKRAVGGSVEIGRQVTPASLAAADGSSRIGWKYDPAFPYISVAEALRQNLHIDSVGAYGDDPAKDTAAFQEAIEFLSGRGAGGLEGGGGRLRLGGKRYLTNATIEIATGNFLKGLMFDGEGTGTVIECVAAGIPALKIGGETFARQIRLANLSLQNRAGGGTLVEFGEKGAVLLDFDHVNMAQYNPSKHLIHAPFGEVYDSRFHGGDWYHHPESTVPAVKIRSQGTTFNENIFENLRCLQSKTKQFFDIENEAIDSWLVNNVIRSINFGICPGGGIRVCNASGWTIQNISHWDAAGPYTNHLIHFAANAGYESVSNVLIAIGRRGDSLAAGIHDIFTEGADSTTAINCFTQGSAFSSYDWNNRNVVTIGPMPGEINFINRRPIMGLVDEFVPTSLAVAGTTTSIGNISTYGRVLIDEVPVLNTRLPTIVKGNNPIENALIDMAIHHGFIAAGA